MSFDVRDYLKRHVLVFDGAMGTYFTARQRHSDIQCEQANVSRPEEIFSIHAEYIEAGAKAIKTNTFALNPESCPDPERLRRLISEGYRIARMAAGDDVAVFADIGPVRPLIASDRAPMLKKLADLFLDLGAENFLFETQSDATDLNETIQYIHGIRPEAFVIADFAVAPDGFSIDGVHIGELAASVPDADAVGMNCGSVPSHMAKLLKYLPQDGRHVCAMPNGSYAGRSAGHTYFDTHPQFYAERMAQMAMSGVSILGGCCGTTPDHIRALCDQTANIVPARFSVTEEAKHVLPAVRNRLDEKIRAGKRVICVEFDPPKDANLIPFMDGAKELQEAGIDAMTIADCPIGRASVDSCLLACKIKREIGLDVIPHMTCRDRNMNASKALLMGVYGEGIRNVLLVTGDPVPTAERESMKGIFQFDACRFARYVRAFSENELGSPFVMYGALNVNAENFASELVRTRNKIDSGIRCFFTQPILTDRGVANLMEAREKLPGAKILGGIIPIVSERNARFMDAEIRGMRVDPEVIRMFEGLDRRQGEDKGFELSLAMAERIAPYTDGYYLITPFRRTALMSRLVRAIREMDRAAGR